MKPVSPRSGFALSERYRLQKLVSMVSLVRLVSRPLLADPIATLPGTVRKWRPTRRSRSAVLAPLDCKYASRKFVWLNSSSVLSTMYWGMAGSRVSRAVVYALFPPVPTGGAPVFGLILDAKSPLCLTAPEVSSQYCSHRSASRISAVARNLRMDASPCDNVPPCANADKLPGKSPVPIVAAPAASIPFCRNRRRVAEFLRILSGFFMTFSFSQIEFAFCSLLRHCAAEPMSSDVGLGRISLADVRNSRMDKEGLSM